MANLSIRGVRILVAEDNCIDQKVMRLMLQSVGFEVDVVSDGKQAAEAQNACPYDLILMDLQMPAVDGWEAVRQIRQSPQRQPVVIAVTSDFTADVRERCLKAGMDGYLSKPFTKDQLLAVISSVHDRVTTADLLGAR
jgi:CheY-like chemotaxis protein